MATKRTPSKTRTNKKPSKKRASKRSSKAPPKRKAQATKARTSKRPRKSASQAPAAAVDVTEDASSNGAARKPKAATKRSSRAPAKKRSKRSTRPAKVKAASKRSGVSAPRAPKVPEGVTITGALEDPPPMSFEPPPLAQPAEPNAWQTDRVSGPEPRARQRDSYLDELPQDHAEVLAGFLRVVKAAAGDIRKLIVQAIALSNQRRDRFDR